MTNLSKAAREALETLRLARDRIVDEGGSGWKALVTRCNRDYMALRAALSEAPGESAALPPLLEPLCNLPKYCRDAIEQYARAMLAARPNAPTVAPLTWYAGAPPFPQDQEWFVAETIRGDRVVLRSLDDGREHKHTYDFTTADGTYMAKRIIARWMQFPDCEFLPPSAPTVALTAPAGLSHSDAQFWLDHRQQIIEAARREGYTIVTTASGVSLMSLGKIEAQGKDGSA